MLCIHGSAQENKKWNVTEMRLEKAGKRNSEIRLAYELVKRESYSTLLLPYRQGTEARLFQQFKKIAILVSPLSFPSTKTTKCTLNSTSTFRYLKLYSNSIVSLYLTDVAMATGNETQTFFKGSIFPLWLQIK
jgi:hypothetical protein